MGISRFYHITRAGRLNRTDSAAEAIDKAREGGFFWLYYVDPVAEDLNPLIEPLKLHPLSVEDALDVNQIPKIDDFPDGSFILFNAFDYAEKTLHVHELDFFLSDHFLISIDRCAANGKPLLDGIEELVRREMDTCRQGPAFVMHTILDAVVDGKFEALEALEDELADIEDAVLEHPGQFDPKSLQHIRRALVSLRKSLFHEREVFVKICRKDCPFIPDKAVYHYRDVYDHLTRLFELTETLRDVATSLMEIDLSLRSNEMSRSSNRTNRSVRRLTVITTIFMPLSLLAGIGGMSEWSMMTGPDNWRITYPLFLLAMIVIGVISYFFLRWLVKKSDETDDGK